MPQIRQPAVAGQFYPASPQALRKQIELFSEKKKAAKTQRGVIGCLLPHAGYIYSGAVAYSVLSQIKLKDNLVILGPNHTGMGEAFSIMAGGSWVTPLGELNINTELAGRLLTRAASLRADELAHKFEHSIEVQLPLLQYFKNDFTFVPIVIASNALKDYQQLGLQIASVIQELHLEKETLIVASSDMTHYEAEAAAKKKDAQAIEAMLELDELKLWSRINELNITMCGYAPAIVLLSAAKALGAKKGELIKYQTSGEVTGDNSSVVGYAGIIVS